MELMPNFILIIGPQAVGKMVVGKKIAEQLNYKFSHNHHSIEFSLEFYEYGTPPFNKIREGIRKLLFDTVIEFEENGFVFTFVLAFNYRQDHEYLKGIINKFTEKGWKPYIVELSADLETRIKRNRTQERLKAKPSKRDIKSSEDRLLASLDKYILNSTGEYPFSLDFYEMKDDQYMKLDNSNLSVEEQVDRIITYLHLDK